VTAIDGVQNTLTVTRGDGRSVTYDPRRLQGVTVYRDAERSFAVGDRVQFTAPFRTGKIANREMASVTAMTDRQDMRVRTDSGKTVKFSVDSKAHGPRAHRHLDHGYAVTSYSSQGLTADRVLLYIDTEQAGERLVNQRLAYVALSRGRHDAQIYTDDRDRLSTALSRDVSKSSAHNVSSAEQTPQRDRSPSSHSARRHSTTIDAGMTRTCVGASEACLAPHLGQPDHTCPRRNSSGHVSTSHARKRNSICAPAKSCTHGGHSRRRQSPSKHVTSQPYSGNWQVNAARDPFRRLRPRCVYYRQSA
jgi:Viral (Superfamily 1) RNA helicase